MATPIKKDPPEDEGLGILQALANVYNWKENLAENINPRSYGFYADDDAPGREDPILGNEAIQRLYNAIVLILQILITVLIKPWRQKDKIF